MINKVKLHACLIILILPLLTSCGSLKKFGLYDDYGVPELSESYSENKKGLLLSALLEQKKVVDINGVETKQPLLPMYCINYSILSSEEESECSALRTIIAGDLIAISNEMCEAHKRSIWGNEASFNMITSTLTNIFSGAATVVTGGTGQAALAALALFSNAERSLGNEIVYKNMLAHAIVQKITEQRTTLRNSITTNIKASSIKNYYDYPINLALNEVIDYHNACSFMSGLELAIKEGTKDKKPQQITKLENQLSILTTQIDARKLYLKNNNIANQENDKHLISLNKRYDRASANLDVLETTTGSTPDTPDTPDKSEIKNAKTDIEKKLSLADGKKIQLALCVDADGIFGEKTRDAIKYYQRTKSLSITGNIGNQTTVTDLVKAQPCNSLANKYKNAFERFKFTSLESIKDFQKQLNESLPTEDRIPITTKFIFDPVFRKAIKKIRIEKKLIDEFPSKDKNAVIMDQITPKLYDSFATD